jgi:ABC-2 type transport system ATP-binding protein
MSSAAFAIEAKGLTKRFAAFVAAADVSFAVPPGETYGLLGPNGAGKTTLVRMLTTLLPPTSGTARVRGHDVVSEKTAVRSVIGTVSQAITTDEHLTVRENLSVQGKMHGLWGRDLSRAIERRLTAVGLWDRRKQITRELSGGMRRRLEIARGVMHSPRVLFLDEPTTGLDPRSRRSVWRLVRELVDRGVTIFLTTHYLEEADRLADRVAVLDHGKVIAEGAPDELKRLVPGGYIQVEFDEPDALDEAARAFPDWTRDDDALTLRVPGEGGIGSLRALLDRLDRASVRAKRLTVHTPDLDDVFLALTGRADEEEEGAPR